MHSPRGLSYEQLQYTPLRPHRYGAAGNAATYSAQGFGIQFGITVIFCKLLLTLHYVAVVCYRYTERQIRGYIVPGFAVVLTMGLALSLPFLFLDGYNFMHCLPSWCWIAPNPETCAMTGGFKDCQAQANLWRNVAYFGPLWICVICVSLGQLQALIFWSVRKPSKGPASGA